MRYILFFLAVIISAGAGHHAIAEDGKDMLQRITRTYRDDRLSADKRRQEKDAELVRQAKDMEAVYLRQVLEEAFPDGDGGLYGDDASTGVYRFMFIEQTAAQWAESGGGGLADMLLYDMKRRNRPAPARPIESKFYSLPPRL